MHLARLTIAAAVALAVAGCQGAADGQQAATPVVGADRIEMHDNAFEPPVVEVPAGTAVTWAFTDGDRRHNVVGDGFASDVRSDGTFTHTFADAGTYEYRCTLHSGMEGSVVVTGG